MNCGKSLLWIVDLRLRAPRCLKIKTLQSAAAVTLSLRGLPTY
jgi:hypothetical protein